MRKGKSYQQLVIKQVDIPFLNNINKKKEKQEKEPETLPHTIYKTTQNVSKT